MNYFIYFIFFIIINTINANKNINKDKKYDLGDMNLVYFKLYYRLLIL